MLKTSTRYTPFHHLEMEKRNEPKKHLSSRDQHQRRCACRLHTHRSDDKPIKRCCQYSRVNYCQQYRRRCNLTSLNQQGFTVYLWKLEFNDNNDDVLATIALKDGKVSGFWLRWSLSNCFLSFPTYCIRRHYRDITYFDSMGNSYCHDPV